MIPPRSIRRETREIQRKTATANTVWVDKLVVSKFDISTDEVINGASNKTGPVENSLRHAAAVAIAPIWLRKRRPIGAVTRILELNGALGMDDGCIQRIPREVFVAAGNTQSESIGFPGTDLKTWRDLQNRPISSRVLS